jgi:hypothetical protein
LANDRAFEGSGDNCGSIGHAVMRSS